MSAASWFWAGVLANIFISIVVGLQLPRIQRWFIDRGKTSHEKKKSRQVDEYKTVTYYALHTDMLIGKMVSVAIWISLYALFFSIMDYAKPTLDNIIDFVLQPFHVAVPLPHFVQVIVVVILFIGLVGAFSLFTMFVMRQVISVHKLYLNVDYFRSFVESVPEEFRDREMEQFVINAVHDRSVPGMNENMKFLSELRKKEEQTNTSAPVQSTTADTPSDPSPPQN